MVKLLSTEDFINRSKEAHGNKYDYSMSVYRGANTKVSINCPDHGEFKQTASKHWNGGGCLICARHRLTTEDFIYKASEIHRCKYDYSMTNYEHNSKKVIIICPQHGKYTQRPNDHLSGKGCSICNKSKGENDVAALLQSLRIKYIREWKHEGCRNKQPLPFDFFLPERNILIEFDGIQHYKPVKRFGGEVSFEKLTINDAIKNKWSLENGYRLIRIPYHEDVQKYLRSLL